MGPRYGAALADLMRLGLLTGARLNELCELSSADVLEAEQAIRITDGKTENARRLIPVHPLVWPILLRRLHAAKDGLLFPELRPGGPDGKRSWYATKRYTEFRRSVLGSDDRVDFHSFRRTFATYLERASTLTAAVNTSVTAELMGHTKTSLAFSLYSGGLTLENLQERYRCAWQGVGAGGARGSRPGSGAELPCATADLASRRRLCSLRTPPLELRSAHRRPHHLVMTDAH